MVEENESPELVPLCRMAAQLGVPHRWLKEQAEAGKILGLKAGNRWLFAPEVVRGAVRAMASAQPKTQGTAS